MKSPALAVTAATLLLAGCANVPTIAYVDNTGQMDRAEFMSVLNDHATLVSVVGSPFPGISDDALARVLAAEMPTGFAHGARYTADPREASGSRYRLVWNFGKNGMDPSSCAVSQAPATGDLAAATQVSAVLAFCRSGGPLMRSYGFVGEASDPQAANFRQWVRQMTLHVLVFEPPTGKGGGTN